MGIAALILGILSLLISFSWFADLALILGVLSIVLGIIAIVKKKEKKLGIASVILSVLAIIILFTSSSGTDGKTGTGVKTDSVKGTSKVSVSTENISMEKIGITASGDFAIKITNNNDGSVCLSDVTTVYKDSENNFVKKVTAYDNFICIPAKSSTVVYNFGFEENFAEYPNYEFSCELANISEDFVYDNIEITSNNTGEQIAVTAKNNNEKPITSLNVVVAFYQNNEIVGIESGFTDEVAETGENSYINVDYPTDSDYNEVSFDKYEVHYISAGID